jgi:hypothetical protein
MSFILPTVLSLFATEIVLQVDHLPPFRRSVARYQLASILPWSLDAASYGDDRFVFDCEAIGATRCQELHELGDEGKIDVRRTKALWSRLYLDTRAERDEQLVIPATLPEFQAVHGYASWPVEVVEHSGVKRAKRTIYRGHTADGRALSVSETEGPSGGVRETEIAIASKDGRGNFHFYVYDANGALAGESEFPAGTRPAPDVCATCHADAETGRVDRFIPRR